nr:ACP S-malonyltransferase [Candidatus Dadabacteria bacterium]NIS08621.1 ACP S-malonyltransferase [Candidatus Dadabacteria bacterium]NIY22527.1 ACP S-malonyltransferase [Candidatus Dadabacteria bacterium]
EDKNNELNLTVNAQPAILTASIASMRVLEEETGIRSNYVAGHSLGEYSALVASGAFNFKDAVATVRKRGEFTQGAVPVGVGSMAAILGLEKEEIEDICKDASSGEFIVSPANFNAPGQTVISGNNEAIEKAKEMAKTKGAKRVVTLDVSAPFHCKMMAPAAEKLGRVLDKIDFSNIKIPLINNWEATLIKDPERLRENLINQVMAPVRWYESIRLLYENLESKKFIEIGPKNVLTNLIRRTLKDVKVVNFDKLSDLKALKENGF